MCWIVAFRDYHLADSSWSLIMGQIKVKKFFFDFRKFSNFSVFHVYGANNVKRSEN